jgi:hypothetical protein
MPDHEHFGGNPGVEPPGQVAAKNAEAQRHLEEVMHQVKVRLAAMSGDLNALTELAGGHVDQVWAVFDTFALARNMPRPPKPSARLEGWALWIANQAADCLKDPNCRKQVHDAAQATIVWVRENLMSEHEAARNWMDKYDRSNSECEQLEREMATA